VSYYVFDIIQPGRLVLHTQIYAGAGYDVSWTGTDVTIVLEIVIPAILGVSQRLNAADNGYDINPNTRYIQVAGGRLGQRS
jgi:hypothetical protein